MTEDVKEFDLSAAVLNRHLATRRMGRRVIFAEELESTNLTLHEMGRGGETSAPEDIVLVADSQTGGRGRSGRSWFSPKGCNLYFSVLLRPECEVAKASQLSIVAAFAVQRALSAYTDTVRVKWPNDIWCRGRKMAGILCGMSCMGKRAEYAVVGIGLNVNLSQFPEGIEGTSLCLECGRALSRGEVLAGILNALEEEYDAWREMRDLAPWQERWRRISVLEGLSVTVEQGGKCVSGVVDGISPEGFLRLRDGGVVHLASVGDAHILLDK